MRKTSRIIKFLLVPAVAVLFLLLGETKQNAQTQVQFPTATGHVNDFANILPAQLKERLETTLQNLKTRSKVEFYVATVENTGSLDIFDYSREMSHNWNVGARTTKTKSLLLVVAVNSKNSFTQFSRLVQNDLPDGVLGEMSQRMRSLLSTGQFADAVDQGVQVFINALSQKIGFSLEDIDKGSSAAVAQNIPSTTAPDASTEQTTRPRTVTEKPTAEATPNPTPELTASPAPAVELPTPKPSESVQSPATTDNTTTSTAPPEAKPTPAPSNSLEAPLLPGGPTPSPTNSNASDAPSLPAKSETKTPTRSNPKAARKLPANRAATRTTPVKKPASTATSEEDDLEQVETTLTKPLAERAELLKKFLDTHPDSKARPRAIELLVSTHAALGDERLKNGDNAGGVAQLMLLIDEADTNVSDKLFSGVIAQIPLNLYLRGEHESAFAAAQKIESKFGSDPKRLIALANFYLGIERGDEVARLATQAVKLAPDMAEAHRTLALGLHISLNLEEAVAEYKRALELDPNSKGSRVSLADLYRATGKPEEALALYREQLQIDPKDKASRTGVVLALFQLNRKDEANTSLEEALTDQAQNLPLLTGVAYWNAAHENWEKALTFSQKAVEVEPRYTWAQIALARTLVGLKHPIDAERSMRYARQFGKFPTLTYELANVLSSMGLYEEAAEALRESFSIKDDKIETRLAGRLIVTNDNFIDLLAPERKASIYQPDAADTAANAKILKDLLNFSNAVTVSEGEKIDEARAAATAREFAGTNDNMRAFRQVYVASRLLRNNVAIQTVIDLTDDARKNVDAAMDTPVATMATQADEYRDLRARAISQGQIPDVASAPRNVLANILRGRIEDIAGWALFTQEKYGDAIAHMKQAVALLPEGTPAWRTSLWHLGVAQEQAGNNKEALNSYIKSYTTGERDPLRRPVIERLYKKVNGSLDGLDEKIGPASQSSSTTTPQTDATAQPSTNATQTASTSTPEKPRASETTTNDVPKQDAAAAKPTDTPAKQVDQPATTSTPVPDPAPTSSAPTATPTDTKPLSDEELRAVTARARSTIKITGRVFDSNKAPLANVVVVLISPSGGVLAATTDSDGKYSFTVPVSQKAYRVIPSKDGFTFSPIDRALASLLDDQRDVDFIGTSN